MKKSKEERNLEKHLTSLVKSIDVFLTALDKEMKKPPSAERGGNIAKLSNGLDMAKDAARFFGLNIDYRTGKKRKANAE